jgi:hypothetical protein
MKVIRRWVKPTSIALTILMLLISVPFQSVLAAMIGTETVMDSARGQEARAYLQQLLAREDVQAALIAHGIDPMEAKSRIDALSDDEVIRIADQIDQLPRRYTCPISCFSHFRSDGRHRCFSVYKISEIKFRVAAEPFTSIYSIQTIYPAVTCGVYCSAGRITRS